MDQYELLAQLETLKIENNALKREIYNLKINEQKQKELITSLFLRLGTKDE